MERLPQELLLRIASFIPRTLRKASTNGADGVTPSNGNTSPDGADEMPRPRLATLSRAWQAAIETHVFEGLRVKSNALSNFDAAFSGASGHRRRRYVKTLFYHIVLPEYSDEACARFETPQEREINDIVASFAMIQLLRRLSRWPDTKLRLVLDIYSPMDADFRPTEKYEADERAVERGEREDIMEERYAQSFITISGMDEFNVSCVDSFYPVGDRALHPTSIVGLTSMFPNPTSISWQIASGDIFLALRRPIRNSFISSLESFSLPHTAKFLKINDKAPEYTHNQRLPDLVGSAPNDPYCAAIHNLVSRSNLENFHYEGQAGPSLLWPVGLSEENSMWKCMTEFSVTFRLESPCGKWYFKGVSSNPFNVPSSDEPLPFNIAGHLPPGYGTEAETAAALDFRRFNTTLVLEEDWTYDDRDYFRVLPNEDIMIPLLEAFARRLSHCPLLKRATLAARQALAWNARHWFVDYASPGLQVRMFDEKLEDPAYKISRCRVYFHVYGWMPDEELLRQFRNIGRDRFGEEAVVTILPDIWRARDSE